MSIARDKGRMESIHSWEDMEQTKTEMGGDYERKVLDRVASIA